MNPSSHQDPIKRALGCGAADLTSDVPEAGTVSTGPGDIHEEFESWRSQVPHRSDDQKAVSAPIVSHSMNREDVLLNRIFRDQATGFYVDVGANSPHRYSNTKHFYDRGWHGINVEPSSIFAELASERPRDINLQVVASDFDGHVDFHECSDSSFSSVRKRTLPAGVLVARPASMPARTLAGICAEHADRSIDFMNIDVEGHELQVLKGNDWTRFRPRVVIIEATELLSHDSAHEAWEPVLLQAGYLLAHFDGINRFYVRQEDAELLRHFAFPPTSLEFITAETIDLRQKLNESEASRSRPLTLWYDLTTLVLFPGNNTGIPRVVTKILEAVPQVNPGKTRLCLYDHQRRCFVKVTPERTRLGKLLARSRELLLPVIRPVRQCWHTLKRAVRRSLIMPRRRLRAWLATKPRLLKVSKSLRHAVRDAARIARSVARMPRASVRLLKDLYLGIRQPHHPAIESRLFLFPFCLLCNRLLKHLPAGVVLRLLCERLRFRQWFWLRVGDGMWVRATSKALRLSASDIVVQVGWNPDQQGIAEAKKEQGFRYVSLVHDLIPVKLPHFVTREFPAQFTRSTSEQLRISDLVLTNSACTLRDLEEFARGCQIDLPPTHVLRFGSEVQCGPARATAPRIDGVTEGEPFVLTVSTLDPRKNHHSLYLVWRKLVEEFGTRTPKLIIVGRPNLHQLLHEMKYDPQVQDKILHLFPIDDRQLDWLYRNCLFTVYPSHYEGWGLPVSESLWYGKFCVAADNSSLPEIGGDLLDYHCPYDVHECHRLIRRAAFDASYRRLREEEIAASYRPTTWRECAESLYRAIQRTSEARRARVFSGERSEFVARGALPALVARVAA